MVFWYPLSSLKLACALSFMLSLSLALSLCLSVSLSLSLSLSHTHTHILKSMHTKIFGADFDKGLGFLCLVYLTALVRFPGENELTGPERSTTISIWISLRRILEKTHQDFKTDKYVERKKDISIRNKHIGKR